MEFKNMHIVSYLEFHLSFSHCHAVCIVCRNVSPNTLSQPSSLTLELSSDIKFSSALVKYVGRTYKSSNVPTARARAPTTAMCIHHPILGGEYTQWFQIDCLIHDTVGLVVAFLLSTFDFQGHLFQCAIIFLQIPSRHVIVNRVTGR